MAEILLGLGGNLGDPVGTIDAALDRLQTGGVRITRRSRFYRTTPWGVTEQPDFVNLCAAADTNLSPDALLALVQTVETALGREPGVRWGPRTIDIDILTYGELTLDEPGLTIPHPRLTERAFVLVPLLDIAPDRLIMGRRVRDWAAMVDRSGIESFEMRCADHPSSS